MVGGGGVNDSSLDERVARIDERTMNIYELLKSLSSKLSEHEARLTQLECWQNRTLGAVGVIMFLVTILIALIRYV